MRARLASFAGMIGLALLALASAGCHEYKYFDIHTRFDGTTFTTGSVATVRLCNVTVSGPDSDSFDLPSVGNVPSGGRIWCPNVGAGDKLEVGTFEFSTFAESGTLTFTVNVYNEVRETTECLLGSGTSTAPVTGAMTTTVELSIVKTGNGCTSSGGGIPADSGV